MLFSPPIASKVFQNATPVSRAAFRCASIIPRTAGIVTNSPSRCVLRSQTPMTSMLLFGKQRFM